MTAVKSRVLDIRNCHALLPQGHVLQVINRLDECLRQIIIDRLVRHNLNTENRQRGSERYHPSPVDVGLGLDVARRTIQTLAFERPGDSLAKLHLVLDRNDGLTWKVIVPLQFLLKGWGDANSGYQGYVHTVAHRMKRGGTMNEFLARQATDKDDYYYVGITKRNSLVGQEARWCRRRDRDSVQDGADADAGG